MGKLKKIITNKRVLILIAFLLLSTYLINPTFSEGVAIRGVVKGSAASEALPEPILAPSANLKPTSREVIKDINGQKIETVKDYYEITSELKINDTLTITTNKGTYFLTIKPEILIIETNETEIERVVKSIFNETTNTTQNVTVFKERPVTIKQIIGPQDIGLNVYPRPVNNLKKGLDLEGGTRVLLQPETEVTPDELDIILTSIKQRLDVYGVADVTVRTTTDFFGNLYISIEIAGVNEEEVKALLTEQGKFEAKIGDETVFSGGNKEVLFVCRTAQCSSVDDLGCGQTETGEWACGFRFSITLSEEAARKQAAATANLDVISFGGGRGYLSKNLTLVLDDEVVDELRISSGLKGNAVTQIEISGSGFGANKKAAKEDAIANMKKLQTILITGSLPVKLNIAETSTITPSLGENFIKNAVNAGLLAALIVILVVSVRYREWKVAIPMALTMISEVIIILGFASLIGWRLDMVAFAAIIIAIGSGVDDQIVITDETISGRKKEETISWKQKLKKAFFIIMASYFTLVVAMVPLMFAGAGLLLGFAITTIAGVTIGVLITRPAFAAILEILVEK